MSDFLLLPFHMIQGVFYKVSIHLWISSKVRKCLLPSEGGGLFRDIKVFFPFGSRTKKHGYKNSIPASAATGSKMERDIF